jgi:hypothetical protein
MAKEVALTKSVEIKDLLKIEELIKEYWNPEVVFSGNMEKMRNEAECVKNCCVTEIRTMISKYIPNK